MHMAAALARYAALTGDPWAREVARRQTILCTYDAHETGVVEDNVDGGVMVAGQWFNLAHPWPLRMVMEMLAWQPEWFGAARENHIMRSTSVVRDVRYGKGRVAYRTFDAAVALRGRVAAGLYADGRLGRRQAVATPAGRGGKRLHGQATF